MVKSLSSSVMGRGGTRYEGGGRREGEREGGEGGREGGREGAREGGSKGKDRMINISLTCKLFHFRNLVTVIWVRYFLMKIFVLMFQVKKEEDVLVY